MGEYSVTRGTAPSSMLVLMMVQEGSTSMTTGALMDGSMAMEGYKNTCERPNWGEPSCPFAYTIEAPVALDDSTQCESNGIFQDNTDHHRFLHCHTKRDGT